MKPPPPEPLAGSMLKAKRVPSGDWLGATEGKLVLDPRAAASNAGCEVARRVLPKLAGVLVQVRVEVLPELVRLAPHPG